MSLDTGRVSLRESIVSARVQRSAWRDPIIEHERLRGATQNPTGSLFNLGRPSSLTDHSRAGGLDLRRLTGRLRIQPLLDVLHSETAVALAELNRGRTQASADHRTWGTRRWQAKVSCGMGACEHRRVGCR